MRLIKVVVVEWLEIGLESKVSKILLSAKNQSKIWLNLKILKNLAF